MFRTGDTVLHPDERALQDALRLLRQELSVVLEIPVGEVGI